MKKIVRLATLAALLGLMALLVTVHGQEAGGEVDPRFVGEIPAPEFPVDLDWLNVAAPLTMDGLRGKIILLDFWTYGCINCIHMIPILEQIEERFADEVVVIGVHSAKFENEGDTTNIRQIVQRYNLHHPVINDSDFIVWRAYGSRAWPTFMVIDPLGSVVAAQSGEVPFEAFEAYLSTMIDYYDSHPEIGTIDRTPRAWALEGAGDPGTPLLYPGKVLADTEGGRLFITDTNHHRIVVADLNTYEVLATIGSGERGFSDGTYDEAAFNQPQGMALRGQMLYIADVNNHAIRAVDLAQGLVTTIAGTGQMGRGLADFSTVYRDPLMAPLRSPWDVAFGEGDTLYIAMAGTHQIWKMDLAANTIQAAVGNGREAQISTTLASSELAQPSGLHYQDGLLYFADSESSTVRVADIPSDTVAVIAGTIDNDLFDFGDTEGTIGESRLQHALGVTANDDGSQVYIADTYNSKIRVHDAATGETTTLLGLGGSGGFRDGGLTTAQFDEPGGLDFAGGRLYVADTNNHAVRVIDIAAQTVETIQFPNPQALVIERQAVTVLGGNSAEGQQVTLDPQIITAGEGELAVTINLPAGYKINPLAQSSLSITSDSEAVQVVDARAIISGLVTAIPLAAAEGSANLDLHLIIFYCEAENEAYCLIDEVDMDVPVDVVADAAGSSILIQRDIILPDAFADDL